MNLKEYKVWDVTTRIFHWVNFLSVFSLIILALIMMYKKEIGLTGVEAKIGLKQLHVLVGYVFTCNLLWRLVWGFIGNKHARWKSILPGKGFVAQLKNYKASISAGKPQHFLGHNPLGRLAITAIILLMLTIMGTGLFRAGTDIYYPPFGSVITGYIAAPGVNSASIKPYNKAGTDAAKVSSLATIKGPAGAIHKYAAYGLMFMIVLHIFFVVRTEISEGGGLITAMFTGKKVFSSKPEDSD